MSGNKSSASKHVGTRWWQIISPFTAIRTPPPLRSPSLRKTLKFEGNSSEEKTEASKCVSVTAIISYFLVKPSASRMCLVYQTSGIEGSNFETICRSRILEEISPHSKSLHANEVRRPTRNGAIL